MKSLHLAKIAASLLMLASFSSHAGVITVSGKSFNDLGKSTIDLTARKEWRDVDLIVGRSTCSIMKDAGTTITPGCTSFDALNTILNTEGWRLATRNEVAQLFTNWMGVTVAPTAQSVAVNPALMTQFFGVFGVSATANQQDFLSDSSNIYQGLAVSLSASSLTMQGYTGNINLPAGYHSAMLVRDAAAAVPEPASLGLLGAGLLMLGLARRRA